MVGSPGTLKEYSSMTVVLSVCHARAEGGSQLIVTFTLSPLKVGTPAVTLTGAAGTVR